MKKVDFEITVYDINPVDNKLVTKNLLAVILVEDQLYNISSPLFFA